MLNAVPMDLTPLHHKDAFPDHHLHTLPDHCWLLALFSIAVRKLTRIQTLHG